MSTVAGFSSHSYIFDPRPSYPLLSVAKRYWKPDSPHLNDPHALTLVFAHGASFHKEHWEPVISDLQGILERGVGKTYIREIWTLDAPNHGDAAVLNERALKSGYEQTFGCEEYGRSIHLFLSGFGTGVDVDFAGHTLVGIGHSMGAISFALSMGYYPKINFASLILCEVMIMSDDLSRVTGDMFLSGAQKRRDIWPSKAEAFKILKSRGMWKTWDERVLRIHVEFGMRSLPTADYPDKVEGITLKCTRIQETACCRDQIGPSRVYHNFNNIVKQVPTHLIYGEIDDYIPAEVKDDIVNNRSGGIENLASFTRVPGAGHLVTQVNPSELAKKIYDALTITSKRLQSSVGWAKL